MAGNKINPKTKGKDEKGKSNKGGRQDSEEPEELDFALLRKPIQTSITGFAHARKIFDLATEELRALLSDECDMLYECKVCRNIFRSLANFISHKRVYCKEKFNSSLHGHFIKATSSVNEFLKIKRMEEEYQDSLNEKKQSQGNDMEVDDMDDRVPLTKDLTAIVENLTKTKGMKNSTEEPRVVLHKIPSSTVAVFQNLNNQENTDNMRTEVNELHNILTKDKAVLQGDDTFTTQNSNECNGDTENVIQISDDEDNDGSQTLKCKICDLQFSTQKTLKFHMKYKHLESRLVYPCPDCLEIFSTSWSVYRHLFKVHRKTAAQIRRLRESIQAKAFRMNNPPAFYEKRKIVKPIVPPKMTEMERLDQENQAWMDNLEGDGEVPRCGGCGRTFERRAALAAHTHTCQPRSRALARRPEAKKIEIQIRKDYNKGPTTIMNLPKVTEENKSSTEENQGANKKVAEESEDADKSLEEATMDILDDDQKSNESIESPEKNETDAQRQISSITRLPYVMQAEKSNLTAFKQKIQPDIEFVKLTCKKCDIKFNSTPELYEHMAGHYKWMRYGCKLCNFKHYNFDKLPEHVKTVHKLKGDIDFYFSTVKAIDGAKALEFSEPSDEINDTNEVNPESRRPSRCSSDSSRLSDDSSSSSTRLETGSRKRKRTQARNNYKRKKETLVNGDGEDQKDSDDLMDKQQGPENDSTGNIKTFEENSSDMDDADDKNSKRTTISQSVTISSRRPVRKKTKPKNEDFEYDLSNLLKMEAQGYRDSQTVTTAAPRVPITKPAQNKKKAQQDYIMNYENMNKECNGALTTLSRKATDIAAAHLKMSNYNTYSNQKHPISNIFARPMIPKTISKTEKTSPKKDTEDPKDSSSSSKVFKTSEITSTMGKEISNPSRPPPVQEDNQIISKNSMDMNSTETKESNGAIMLEKLKSNFNIPAVVPIKFRRQSLELIKNPIINKNITDFTKAGMKTKILVIKPINRNKDKAQSVNTPLKFQTIKLKDPKVTTTSDNAKSDQVVVVKVPQVDYTSSINRQSDNSTAVTNEKSTTISNALSNVQDKDKNDANIHENKNVNEQESDKATLTSESKDGKNTIQIIDSKLEHEDVTTLTNECNTDITVKPT